MQAWSTACSGGMVLQMVLTGGQRRGGLRPGHADVRLRLLSCFSMVLAARSGWVTCSGSMAAAAGEQAAQLYTPPASGHL